MNYKLIFDYLDKLWLPEIVWYRFSSSGIESKNVSKFLKEQLLEPQLKEIADEHDWTNPNKADDWKIVDILKYVHDNIKYVSDRIQYKESEHWATIAETLTSREGDCEDGAILIYCLARTSGIPIEKIKLVAGSVKDGGHAWIRYVSEVYIYSSFNIDWCYYYDSEYVKERMAYIYNSEKIIGDNKYCSIWFMADEEKGYRSC